ncbi:MAG: YebC/PmpR family DNA-binding transcriptional regulator [Thermoguttaceae bacterium]|jgi:YebC/PmpR family DNA-binding regulatory protein
MSGHSHSSNIRHKKALVDAKRGKIWSKLAKAIIVAAKMGGGDLDANYRLRFAVDAAKAVSMPKENIQRAIKRGTGELEGSDLEEILYEGYGSGGVAVLCEVLTDSRNRTAAEIRKIFELSDGKLGGVGSVAWMFEKKGFFLIPADKTEEDALLELALEAGADDVKKAGDKFEVTCTPEVFHAVSDALEKARIEPEIREIHRMPKNTVDVSDPDTARKVLKLMNRLDDQEDVQNVSSNYEIPDAVMAQVGEE